MATSPKPFALSDGDNTINAIRNHIAGFPYKTSERALHLLRLIEDLYSTCDGALEWECGVEQAIAISGASNAQELASRVGRGEFPEPDNSGLWHADKGGSVWNADTLAVHLSFPGMKRTSVDRLLKHQQQRNAAEQLAREEATQRAQEADQPRARTISLVEH